MTLLRISAMKSLQPITARCSRFRTLDLLKMHLGSKSINKSYYFIELEFFFRIKISYCNRKLNMAPFPS